MNTIQRWMSSSIILIGACVASGIGMPTAEAQSIWQNRKPDRVHLFHDSKARSVGDLITITINENTDVSNQDRRAMDLSAAAEGDAKAGYSGGASGEISGDFRTNGKRNRRGSSATSVAREFSDRFTVEVIDIYPNGNFMVSGQRRVMVEGDERTLTLSGVIRQLDIRDDNSVDSKSVAKLEIKYDGRGPESSFTRQGWLGRRVNRVWPF